MQEFNIYLPGAIFVVLQGNKNDTTEKTFKIIVQVGWKDSTFIENALRSVQWTTHEEVPPNRPLGLENVAWNESYSLEIDRGASPVRKW